MPEPGIPINDDPDWVKGNGQDARKAHELKTWTPWFNRILDGSKPFELRWDDRHFKVGDILRLREWNPQGEYTGRKCERQVSYVFRADQTIIGGLEGGYVILGLTQVGEAQPPISQLIQQAREFANDLEATISAHKGNFEDWIRDDGKRSVVIVEYQLNKNSLGEETRLVNELADALSEYEQRELNLRALAKGFRRNGIAPIDYHNSTIEEYIARQIERILAPISQPEVEIK